MEDTDNVFAQTTISTNIHTANIMFTNIILMVDKQNMPKGKIYSNCWPLHEHLVCTITQRNNIIDKLDILNCQRHITAKMI